MNLFEVFIKIGADTSESDKAIKDTGAKTKELGEKVKSGLKTVAKVSAATMGAMAAGVAKVVKDATAAYADYEQLVGGVDSGTHRNRNDITGLDCGDTAVDLGNVTTRLKLVEIAADGVFGDTEHLTKLVDSNSFVGQNILFDGIQSADFHDVAAFPLFYDIYRLFILSFLYLL